MNTVRQVFPIGAQWPTLDPFLFTAHHLDRYPAGTETFGPDPALLVGRHMCSDFEGKDGWNMYHGREVPGFPQHPHRGFETITYVRTGLCDHTDSMGAAARFGQGDTQWVTTGQGVVHAELFPLVHRDRPNTLELFQIWLNLPAKDKMVPAHFKMLWSEETPRVERRDGDGPRSEITIIAGEFDGKSGQAPPPHSWAVREEAAIAVWHIRMEAGAKLVLPPSPADEVNRALYVFDGSEIVVDGEPVRSGHGAVLRSTVAAELVAGDGPVEAMVLQGRPIGEPVAKHGPFVMNTEAEIRQAFRDYQETQFGGWPWPEDAPHHGGAEQGRFAKHADGRREDR
ncbi:Quercetin 2,3-dioxygenase [Planctomycetes bacterium Poly30]|uniref:Quercetin 2,3-dioxygenase n=1 Tax=Saltatorellus ferox TaxID=2528018 RepID=A0A518EKD7_9BACT|nr:Quercetin 2,3-dioxygenase [Planctomycetes bacterium Poly30]